MTGHSRPRRRRRALRIAGLVVAIVLVAVALPFGARQVIGRMDAPTVASFYSLPAELPAGAPGELIRARLIPEAPVGSVAWRYVYHTRDLAGRDIAASAVMVEPIIPPLGGDRVAVAWGHPTTGAAQDCAPSLAVDPFELMEGVHELLASGFAVVAADYPGLGVAGASSYLLGVPESNSMLDAVRAARTLPRAQIGDRVLLWGHSQGGQAALFAAQRIRSYAPELHLAGVAVAAPATNLPKLLDDDLGDVSGVTITSYAIPAMQAAYRETYPGPGLTGILTPRGASATPTMAALCLNDPELHRIARPLIGGYLTADPATTAPWSQILAENSVGGSPIDVPILIGQGLADKLVKPTVTEEYARSLCAKGENVTLHTYRGVNHGFAAYRTLPDALPFFQAALRGDARSHC
jgi:acetyl esterase/lipase